LCLVVSDGDSLGTNLKRFATPILRNIGTYLGGLLTFRWPERSLFFALRPIVLVGCAGQSGRGNNQVVRASFRSEEFFESVGTVVRYMRACRGNKFVLGPKLLFALLISVHAALSAVARNMPQKQLRCSSKTGPGILRHY